jgi:pimeloyl-ACP methyl ester carboxylesterase
MPISNCDRDDLVTLKRSLTGVLLGLFACGFSWTFEAVAQSLTASAPTLSVDLDGARIAYRSIGNRADVPLLLLNRFRGTMDDWDPALIDRIASERQVLMFDQPGFARSAGTAPQSLSAFAANTAGLVRALGYRRVDVLGFSMGGTLALQFALDHPDLLRRLIVAGSGPGYVPEPTATLSVAEKDQVWPVATKPVNVDADFLFLFFESTPSSQAAGSAYLKRLRERPDAFTKVVDAAAWQAQLRSAMALGSASTSLLPKLSAISHPTLVANGKRDIMVSTYASFAMAQAMPNARLVVYPDSGHGFLFQSPDDFADEVLRFLR